MTSALIVGRARCVWNDVQRAHFLTKFDQVCLVGSAGIDYPGPADHWITFHASHFPKWIEKRARKGYAPIPKLWTGSYKGHPIAPNLKLPIKHIACNGGSSGLIAVLAMLHEKHDKIVLAGVPMDPKAGRYDLKGDWTEAVNYRKAWQEIYNDTLKDKVRSMSGWTRELLGEPTVEWLESRS